MNPAQIHLALNHMPLFLSLVAGLVMITGLWKKSDLVITLGLYGLTAAALFTIPVYLTGEGTEELVEKIPAINKGIIEDHESFAKISMAVIAVTGVISLFTIFIRRNNSLRKGLVIALCVFSLISFLLMAQTASLGGKIRHTEIASVAADGKGEAGNTNEGPKADAKEESDKDDD